MKKTEEIIEVLEKFLTTRGKKLSKKDVETLKGVIENIKVADSNKNPKERAKKLLNQLGLILKFIGLNALRKFLDDGEP